MRTLSITPAIWTGIVGALVLTAMVASMRKGPWPFPNDVVDAASPAPQVAEEDSIGVRYARALREGNCDEAIAMTLWMSERIQHTRLERPEDVADIREELCRSLTDRPIEGNRLTEEGIEDQYVFAPGSTVEWAGSDDGHADLARPVAHRAWIRVSYPREDRAPLDLNGIPIRSMVVGVNITEDAYVLKASVLGNLEIPRDQIDNRWPTDGGAS